VEGGAAMSETPAPRESDFVTGETRRDQALELAARVASMVPWLGGPVSTILSGQAFGRRMERVEDVLKGVAADLHEFRSDAGEQYVRTDEFQELFEAALRKAADERNADRRQVYRSFIVNAIRTPGSYDERLRALRLLDELEPDHLAVLAALARDPGLIDSHGVGSIGQTLGERLGQPLTRERLTAVVGDLTARHLISTIQERLHTTMTARGAQDLRNAVTPLGYELLGLVTRD